MNDLKIDAEESVNQLNNSKEEETWALIYGAINLRTYKICGLASLRVLLLPHLLYLGRRFLQPKRPVLYTVLAFYTRVTHKKFGVKIRPSFKNVDFFMPYPSQFLESIHLKRTCKWRGECKLTPDIPKWKTKSLFQQKIDSIFLRSLLISVRRN